MEFNQPQKNYNKVLKIFKEELDILSKKEFDEKLNKLSTDIEKEEFKKEQNDLLKEAKVYACLHNVYKVKYIAWKPKLTKQFEICQHPDGSLKASYVCTYLDEKKAEQMCNVRTEWADA